MNDAVWVWDSGAFGWKIIFSFTIWLWMVEGQSQAMRMARAQGRGSVMWQKVAFNLCEGYEADVVPCAADGGRCRTWESGGIQEEKGSQCDRSWSPEPRFNGRSPSLTATRTCTYTSSLPLQFPALPHTHSLSLLDSESLSHPFLPRSPVSSLHRGVQREVIQLLGWLKVVRLGQSETAGDLRDRTALRRFQWERFGARFTPVEIICITKPVERGLWHYTGCTTTVCSRGAI